MAELSSTLDREIVTLAEQETRAGADWWNQEWLKFPTISRDGEGTWRYWDIPQASGIYGDDWVLGEALARDTVVQMQRFAAGSSALRRILREIDFDSTIAQGFLNGIEDMLANPPVYLETLDGGAGEA